MHVQATQEIFVRARLATKHHRQQNIKSEVNLKSEFPSKIRRCRHGVYDPFGCGCPCEICKAERSPEARNKCPHARTPANKIASLVAGGFDKKLAAKGLKQNFEADLDSDVVTREEGVAAEWAWRGRVKNPYFVRGRKLPKRLQWAYNKYFLRALVSKYAVRESDKGRHLLIIYWYLCCGFSARDIAEERHCTEQQIQSQLQRLIARAESTLGESGQEEQADEPRIIYDEDGKKVGYAHDPLGRMLQTPEGEVGPEPVMYACSPKFKKVAGSDKQIKVGIGSPDDTKYNRWQFEIDAVTRAWKSRRKHLYELSRK